MNADVAMVFPAVLLFSLSVVLTVVSLWMAGKLAPWLLEESFEPPAMRSYFLDPAADMGLTRARCHRADCDGDHDDGLSPDGDRGEDWRRGAALALQETQAKTPPATGRMVQ